MNAILNVSVGGWYGRGAKRLEKSLNRFGETADRLFFNHFLAHGRAHVQCPYCFKVDAFLHARMKGYDKAIWLDSSCWLVKPLDEAWKHIETHGYLLGMEGWTVGQWCSPEVRDLLGRTQEDLDAMTLVEGKMIGLDFSSSEANAFLDKWNHYSEIGVFNGSWNNHRHDITAAGIIASDMQLSLTPNLIEFAHKGDPHPEVYVRASGMI